MPVVCSQIVAPSLSPLMSAVCYALWFELMGRLFFYIVYSSFPESIKRLESKQRHQCFVYCVSTFFACTIVPLALCSLYLHVDDDEPSSIFDTPLVALTSQLALGYFVWDLFICVRFYEDYGPAFLLHALFCTITYYNAVMHHNMVIYSLSALLYETSTPFLNLRWFLRTVLKHDGYWWIVCNKAFAAVFLTMRVGYGSYLTSVIVHYCWLSKYESVWMRGSSALMISLSFALNGWWSITIVQNIIKYSYVKRV